MDVVEWLRHLGLEQYTPAFLENEVDSSVLPDLSAEDLKDLGVNLVGHRRRLLEAIAALRANNARAATGMSVSPPLPASPASDGSSFPTPLGAERRQLTVMFCDLVDSTSLSARLDPEDLGDVIRTYQSRVADTIGRFGGSVALYMGDGVLIYFGWPEAGEADAERAVRAALAVVAKVGQTPVCAEALRVRIGIATGLVVVGEEIGSTMVRQQAVIGETPNRAARLQGLAGPNSIAIDATTRQQIGRLFDCRDLGAVALKGLPEPIRAWIVQCESAIASRFEALRSSQVTPLVSRAEELDLLLRRWAHAVRGEGKVVLLSGEPGIGKSRLIVALEERLQGDHCTSLRYSCSPHHQESPLYPIVGQLERAAGFGRTDTTESKLGKLVRLFADIALSDEGRALLIELLSISAEGVPPAINLSPQRRKERTFEALVRQIEKLAATRPLLMLIEDAHWADPSSLEFFDMVIERVAGLSVLLVMTFRPEFQAPWIGRAGVTFLTLGRFTRREAATMATEVAGCTIPTDLLERIVAQTDGVPLFVEEWTRAVLEVGLDDASRLATPVTLQASLMARLDQLPAAKTAAQVGSVIGRSFSYVLIAAIGQLPDAALSEGLLQLVGSGLAFQRGEPPGASYTFKHALVQDTVYTSLLRSRRAVLHGRLAQALLQHEPQIERTDPGLLAHHYEQAGLFEQAIDMRLTAGRLARASSSTKEAVTQLQKGLGLLGGMSDDVARLSKEIDLQLALGGTLAAARGEASPEGGNAFHRACDLCRAIGGTPRLVPALWGVWAFRLNRAELAASVEAAAELLDYAEHKGDAAAELIGHRCLSISTLFQGELCTAKSHAAKVFALHGELPYGIPDAQVEYPVADSIIVGVTHSLMAWASLLQGQFERALNELRKGVHSTTARSNPHTVAIALHQSCVYHQVLGSAPGVEQRSNELMVIAVEHDFPLWIATATFFIGWCAAVAGERVAGLARMRGGLEAAQGTGRQVQIPYYLGLMAQVLLGTEPEEAISLLADALARVERTGERWFEAELHRLKGEALLCASDPPIDEAQACFQEALTVARKQGAALWELRTTMSLAKLLQRRGHSREAGDLLAPIYNGFTEGLDAIDLRNAKALLNELT